MNDICAQKSPMCDTKAWLNIKVITHLRILAIIPSLSKKNIYCNDSKITKFFMFDAKNSSTAYVVMYELIT